MHAFGPYELVRRIAVGGMAEVFLAKVVGIAGFEKHVAIKMIHANYTEDEELVTMLVEEAKVAVQLSHANIAQTFDLGRVNNTYYITMEYVDGVDLHRLIHAARRLALELPVEASAFVGKEVAQALEHAHANQVVHRDVSPENVLLSYDGLVKLVDFGIARATRRARQTMVGVIKGKYHYMSPEQASGETVDGRSDIYSTGIVLYEMLTGQTPHRESDFGRLLELVRAGAITPPSILRPAIPLKLERIVMKCLAVRPKDRYQVAGDLASELSKFLRASRPVFKAPNLGALVDQTIMRAQAWQRPDTAVDDSHEPSSTRRIRSDQLARSGDVPAFHDENSVIQEDGRANLDELKTPRVRVARAVTPPTDERFGRFDVHEVIGTGGMATVHRATYVLGGVRHTVALKRLRPELADDENFVDNFVREANLSAQLTHPNIVQVFEFGRIGHVHYLAIELVRGTPLLSVMRRAFAAPIGVAVSIISELLGALDYAYNGVDFAGDPLHVVHRDLSPGNLLITEDGHVKVIDFGVAKATSGWLATNSGVPKGKLGYMAPEALSRSDIDARVDVFATGVVAWELLAGKRLFYGDSQQDILAKLLTMDPPLPSKFNKRCSAELDAVVLRALARDRDARWPSALAMRSALMPIKHLCAEKATPAAVAAWVAAYMLGERVQPPGKRAGPPPKPAGEEHVYDDEIAFTIAGEPNEFVFRAVPFEPAMFDLVRTPKETDWIEDSSKHILITRGEVAPPLEEASKWITIEPGAEDDED